MFSLDFQDRTRALQSAGIDLDRAADRLGWLRVCRFHMHGLFRRFFFIIQRCVRLFVRLVAAVQVLDGEAVLHQDAGCVVAAVADLAEHMDRFVFRQFAHARTDIAQRNRVGIAQYASRQLEVFTDVQEGRARFDQAVDFMPLERVDFTFEDIGSHIAGDVGWIFLRKNTAVRMPIPNPANRRRSRPISWLSR